MQIITQYFIRPELLLIILPLLLIVAFIIKSNNSGNWAKVIDKHLLNKLIIKQKSNNYFLYILIITIFIISVIAMSGISLESKKIKSYNSNKLHIILLDTSPSMIAADIKPSRLKMAKIIIKQLLKQKKDAEVMLVAFAGEPYIVVPATKDNKPIINLIDKINTKTIPKPGSRLDLALNYILEIINKYPDKEISILLLTDAQTINNQSFIYAKKLKKQKINLSVIAVAKKNKVAFKYQGKIKYSKVNQKSLQSLVKTTNGNYQIITNHINNINKYLAYNNISATFNQQKEINYRIDNGVYLLFILIIITLLLFRYE